jgi:hypothetical protein
MWPLSPTAAHVELLWCGLRAGMPRPWRVKALRSDGQVVPSSAAAVLTLPSCSARAKARPASARSVGTGWAASPQVSQRRTHNFTGRRSGWRRFGQPAGRRTGAGLQTGAIHGLAWLARPSVQTPTQGSACARGRRIARRSVGAYLRMGRRIRCGRSFDLKTITVMRSCWEQTARRPRITRRWWAPPGTQDEENQQL